jgi:glucose uptake protein
MFGPQSFRVALLMMVVAAICWGSWANTFRSVKEYRLELFGWDYAIGMFLASLVYAYTMGGGGRDHPSFLFQVRAADASNIDWAILAGVIFNLANLLLVAGIGMAGLATAFPVALGIAMVVGVLIGYVLEPKGNPGALSAGVLSALVAVILDSKAYGQMGAGAAVSRKSIVTCCVSGGLMGLCAPLSTRSLTHGNALDPYGLTVFFTLGALLSCFIWNVYFMRKPLVGAPVGFAGFFEGPVSGHLLGLLGGAIWATGMVFTLVAASFAGMAISYAIGQTAPMVAALWGIFAWKEFLGANRRATTYLALMFIFYVVSILLFARANTSVPLLALRTE